MALLGPGDGFAELGIGKQLVWAERAAMGDGWPEIRPKASNNKKNFSDKIAIIYKVLSLLQMQGSVFPMCYLVLTIVLQGRCISYSLENRGREK